MEKRDLQQSGKRAVVLLSGGLDSATVLYEAKRLGYECRCLLFSYGQRHAREIVSAKRIARAAGCPVKTVSIRLPWGGSSLLGCARRIPVNRSGSAAGLPSTYVPGRNTIFISFALSYAETVGASAIFIGANAVDFSGYPDCRPAYYRAWNRLLKSLGLAISIEVPLIDLDKAQIVRLGNRLGVPYAFTWSCYEGKGKPCGVCDSCLFRARGFREAGLEDPAQKEERRSGKRR